MARRISRIVPALALALALGAATGCTTVDGENARVAPLDRREAAHVLADFDARNNEVYARRDAALNAAIETGPVGAIDQASLRVMEFGDPERKRQLPAFTHDNPTYWIPRTVGWPKWFAVHNTPSYDSARPMLLVFTKQGPDAAWQAAWGPVLRAGASFPEPYRDKDGYVEQLPSDAPGLAILPRDTAGALTGYLTDGSSSAHLFAPGPNTSEARLLREQPVQNGFVRQFVDTPAQYEPLAIRTREGGALVLFAVKHSMKLTVQPPNTLGDVEPAQQAFLAAKPTRSVTEHKLAAYAAVVPPAGAGQVQVVATMAGVVGADGE